MMRPKKVLFFCTSITLFVLYSVLFKTKPSTIILKKAVGTEIAKTYPYSKMKYILQWTKSYTEPFAFMGRGQHTFIKRRCAVNNCFITSDKNFLSDLRDYDAILFHGPEICNQLIRWPKNRSPHQKYVFVSMESSSRYPAFYDIYNDFFNWTWTYRLNSDIYYGYIMIKNKTGDIIGPKEEMHWLKLEDMEPINERLKQKLNRKTIAAAWFVSNCQVRSGRGKIAKQLQYELENYNMTVDIYGHCGTKRCPRLKMKRCLGILEKKYYFYLAFENAIGEDYVTEKLLHALQHYTVPIVYGGANYTRFMPDGTYLNVLPLDIERLVRQMVDIINNKEKYYDFFRWTNHYSYHYGEEYPETDYYCNFCRKINDVKAVKQVNRHENFLAWWNGNNESVSRFGT